MSDTHPSGNLRIRPPLGNCNSPVWPRDRAHSGEIQDPRAATLEGRSLLRGHRHPNGWYLSSASKALHLYYLSYQRLSASLRNTLSNKTLQKVCQILQPSKFFSEGKYLENGSFFSKNTPSSDHPSSLKWCTFLWNLPSKVHPDPCSLKFSIVS